jgi:hypothetical protein
VVNAAGQRTGGRPNRDRRVKHPYLSRAGIARIDALASEEGITWSAMCRRLLGLGRERWESRPRPQRT